MRCPPETRCLGKGHLVHLPVNFHPLSCVCVCGVCMYVLEPPGDILYCEVIKLFNCVSVFWSGVISSLKNVFKNTKKQIRTRVVRGCRMKETWPHWPSESSSGPHGIENWGRMKYVGPLPTKERGLKSWLLLSCDVGQIPSTLHTSFP